MRIFFEQRAKTDGKPNGLQGTGAAFIKAEQEHHVNAAFLAASVLCEAGINPHQKNGVYSLLGWNAINSSPSNQYNPNNSGAGKTKQEAIINGAKVISDFYVSKGRDTAYKMRWDVNPKGAKSQYAIAVDWASARSDIMHHLYDSTQNDAIYKKA